VSTAPTPQEVTKVEAAIERVVGGDAYRLVNAYYMPTPQAYSEVTGVLFAGRHFDELPGNDVRAFTVGDLAAASLLDVRFGPHAVVELLERDACNALLAEIPSNLALWEVTSEHLGRDSAAWQLWRRLVSIPGVSQTRASKLLARKRPHLMPILDSVIVDRLCLERLDGWQALREALTPELRIRINELATAATIHGASRPSTLRLLDVATWMTYSRSRQAKAVRLDLGAA
jgi:Family of unknown function (DUF6308)